MNATDTKLAEAEAANLRAMNEYRVAFERVTEHEGVSAERYDAFNEATSRLFGTAGAVVAAAIDRFERDFVTAIGIVAFTPDGHAMKVAAVQGGQAILTSDGGYAHVGEWHRGEQTGESVFVERWDREGRRTFHGYVDPATRRVVQTG